MKNKALNSVIRIICFSVLLCAVILVAFKALKIKHGDGIYDLKKFYELENNKVDVLVLGSSHAFEHFNTGTLWDEYGMASFVLGGSAQPLWNTYYYLKEALKTQTPKLIVLEGYFVTQKSEYAADINIVKNTFGLKWSPNKVEAICASAPLSDWTDYFLSYSWYHSRYAELTKEDFASDQGMVLYRDWKGFGCNMDTEPQNKTDLSGITERSELAPKEDKYYRAILELAREKDIPILVTIAPCAGISPDQQKVFNRAGDIASEMGVPFIDCNLLSDEIGIDDTTDYADVNHLNYRGNRKFSKFIGGYIKDNYDIPDRTGDDRYVSWQKDADYIRRIIDNHELSLASTMDELISIDHSDYWVFVSADGNVNLMEEEIPNDPGKIEITPDDRYLTYKSHDFHFFSRYDEDKETRYGEVDIDGGKYVFDPDSLSILIYDPVVEDVVGTFLLDDDGSIRYIDQDTDFQ